MGMREDSKIYLSGELDLNQRPLHDTMKRATAALSPDLTKDKKVEGLPGFEPGTTGLGPGTLPLSYRPYKNIRKYYLSRRPESNRRPLACASALPTELLRRSDSHFTIATVFQSSYCFTSVAFNTFS